MRMFRLRVSGFELGVFLCRKSRSMKDPHPEHFQPILQIVVLLDVKVMTLSNRTRGFVLLLPSLLNFIYILYHLSSYLVVRLTVADELYSRCSPWDSSRSPLITVSLLSLSWP